jgi:hypothetical protein
MDILHHLAQAAAVLLLLELLVVLIIFLAISGGLAFGLRYGRGKLGPLLEKVNGYLPLVPKYTQIGTDYAAKPLILAGGLAENIRVTLAALERRIRQVREAHEASQAAAASPVSPADETTESIEPLTTT